MSGSVGSVVYYVNGIGNTWASAEETRQEIEAIVRQYGYSQRVELCYNGSFSTVEMTTLPCKFVLSCVVSALFYQAVLGKNQPKNKWLLAACILVSATALTYVWEKIEVAERKRITAEYYSESFREKLETTDEKITLVLHSQGADLGCRILSNLQEYKDRIRVLAIGPYQFIPSDWANRMTHIFDERDPVPNWLADSRTNCSKTVCQSIRLPECQTAFCHGMEDALSSSIVRQGLLNALWV